MQFRKPENGEGRIRYAANKKLAVVLTVIAVLALITAGVSAKYVTSLKTEAEMISAGFHISSDYLRDDSEPSYDIYDFGSGIQITINNFELENVALTSECDIEYEVKLSSDGWYYEVWENGVRQEMKDGKYTLKKDSSAFSQTLVLKKSEDTAPDDVSVTVKTVSPFVKTFQADFHVEAKTMPAWSIVNHENYCVLQILSNGYAGQITVQWNPEQVSPDNTNGLMSSWEDSNPTGNFTADAYTSYELIFLKNKTTDSITGSGSGMIIPVGVPVGG